MAKTYSYSIDALASTLESAPAILHDLLAAIPRERLVLRRKPHFWTIREHVAHLAEVQPMLVGRLERFRDEPTPSFVPYSPPAGSESSDAHPEDGRPALATVDEALETFSRWRRRLIELIRGLPEETWTKQAIHPEFEIYTALILVRHIAMHDHWHMYRIEELWITKDAYLTEVE